MEVASCPHPTIAFSLSHHDENIRGKVNQGRAIFNAASILHAHFTGKHFLCPPEGVHQLPIEATFLDGGQIPPCQVFLGCCQTHLLIGKLDNDDRNGRQSRFPGCVPSSVSSRGKEVLPRHCWMVLHRDRWVHSLCFDGVDELGKF